MIHEARLWLPDEKGAVVCSLCSHRCRIRRGEFGVCGVRKNLEGRLVTYAYGEVVAVHADPIEKKPLYHFLPGTRSLSIATAGCNFRCPFCQNWQISQLRRADGRVEGSRPLPPEDVVRLAEDGGCRSVSYTYTEPTIFYEYAADCGRLAKRAGLANVFVTNGYMTAEALESAKPWLDACNVDLKAFRDDTYKRICGARLEPVLESIRLMARLKIWLEVTTLVVPGLNDGSDELRDIARFIAGVGADIPWHISRYHPDYKYDEAPPTPLETLRKAADIGAEEGLRFVYIGNVAAGRDDTVCPSCGAILIRRAGFSVSAVRLKNGRCPKCGTAIPGVFG
ncbi:MAG: AmmeMemoRadiSam system radical SAM enzyme [Candidatus Aminicenantes bacterium]|nr:AmmeMemoRadiSam system radical SAM enzyme [Candidatus Aminicenantes bacterium]